MRSIFYDNLINTDELMARVSQDLHHLEQEALHEILEEIIHHRILEAILDEIPKAHHENFLLRFQADPNDLELFTFIKFHSPEIESKINQTALAVIEEIKSELFDN